MTLINAASKFVAVGSLLFVVGCNQSSVTEKAAQNIAPTASAAVKPIFSVNEMMVFIVDEPGELLWEAEKEGHVPKTDEDWYQLENHAVSLASAATLIQLGGTGAGDNDWASYPEWKSSSQALVTAALNAREAAKNHDLASLTNINGQIVEACQACHDKFKPDLPTGGLFIHTRPGTGLDPLKPAP